MKAPATDLDHLPLVLTIDDIVSIYRIGRSTLYRQCVAQSFRPSPFATEPYRWLRADVERDLSRRAGQRPNPADTPASRRGRKRRTTTNAAA